MFCQTGRSQRDHALVRRSLGPQSAPQSPIALCLLCPWFHWGIWFPPRSVLNWFPSVFQWRNMVFAAVPCLSRHSSLSLSGSLWNWTFGTCPCDPVLTSDLLQGPPVSHRWPNGDIVCVITPDTLQMPSMLKSCQAATAGISRFQSSPGQRPADQGCKTPIFSMAGVLYRPV